MDYLLSIVAGVVQGVAEFLPISSSGHLIVFHDILHFNLPDNLLFDVMLHWGTLAALVVFFYRDIIQLVKGFFSSLRHWDLAHDTNQRLAWLVLVGTIPAAITGYFLDDILGAVRAIPVVAAMFIIVGILFLVVEKYSKKIRTIDQMTWADTIIVGVAQGLALVPGISRSGITIITGLMRDMKREAAARFSFLLSMPIVFAAGSKELLKVGSMPQADWIFLTLGFVSSFVSGYVVIKFLLKYLSNHSLSIFAYYRIVLGLVLFVWVFWGRGL